MANNTNTNQVPLSSAWQEYWSVLFENSNDWNSCIEQEVLHRFVFLELDGLCIGVCNLDKSLPTWAQELKVNVDDRTATMHHKGFTPLQYSLFSKPYFCDATNWEGRHPFKSLTKHDPLSRTAKKHWENDCQKIFVRIILDIGREIQHALSKKIRTGALQVLGQSGQTVFDTPTLVPVPVFSSPFKLDLINNTISFTASDAKITTAIIRPTEAASPNNRSNSFRDADLILVEEMKQLIDSGNVPSILKAAQAVISKAKRKGKPSDHSVVERLQRRFQRKYPNYMRKTRNKN